MIPYFRAIKIHSTQTSIHFILAKLTIYFPYIDYVDYILSLCGCISVAMIFVSYQLISNFDTLMFLPTETFTMSI